MRRGAKREVSVVMKTYQSESGQSGAKSVAVAEARPAGKAVEEFITKREVANRLNKKVRTVDNWMKRGWLPYYKVGRSVVFKWTEIEVHLGQTCRVCVGG